MLIMVVCNTERLRQGEKLTAMLSLPATDEQIGETAKVIGLAEFEPKKYHFDDWSFDEGLDKLNTYIGNGNAEFPPTFDGTNLDKLLDEARKELEKSQQMGGMEL